MSRIWSALTPRRLLMLLVGLPMLLGSVYFLGLAQDRYVSTSMLTVKRANQEGVSTSGLALLIAGAGGSSHEDTLYLRDYIHSLGLMQKLDASLKLREHFQDAPSDPFYRLWPQASQEWMLEYWRSRVEVTLDDLSGLLTVRVEGFEPEYAQRLNQAILVECEAFVNTISQRIAQEQMGFAQKELDQSTSRLQLARATLLSFQSAHQMLDPIAQAQAAGGLMAEMRAQLAKVESELSAKRAYLNEDTAEIVTLKGQASALRQQILKEARGATQSDQGALNKLAAEFHELKARAGFAEDTYKAALAAVENTRMETARKVKSLVVIEPSTRPQRAEYPRRLYNLVTLLVASLLMYAIVRLAVATVNEHRD